MSQLTNSSQVPGDRTMFRSAARQPPQTFNYPHNRCILLFDMDCFYAQCERVRLGLDLDVKLCLFQWNSVLAVTYPARELGIKRGDSWDDVRNKSEDYVKKVSYNKKNEDDDDEVKAQSTSKNKDDDVWRIHLPILRCNNESNANFNNNNSLNQDDDCSHDLQTHFDKVYKLSREEQLRCQKEENGLRHFGNSGKASLERYRLASVQIFSVVLKALNQRILGTSGYSFILERASIDEFYLDLTDYCYQYRENRKNNYDKHGNKEGKTDAMDNVGIKKCAKADNCVVNNKMYDSEEDIKDIGMQKTVIVGKTNHVEYQQEYEQTESVLKRACHISTLIREEIWNVLGFTMTCGISTNKMMAKLAASYGKPNGQAVIYPQCFPNVLKSIKVKKVRNFGGKLGKKISNILIQYQKQQHHFDCSAIQAEDFTMADLNQIPLPFLLQSELSEEQAHFVFQAGNGIDHEAVKETTRALVKSITAFKSFPATKSHTEIFDIWLKVLSKEIIERVEIDTARNKRYPKSCTLNYTYYTTPSGTRPPSGSRSTRNHRQSRSIRLTFPSERNLTVEKSASLLAIAKSKLIPILKDHPLRGIGLSVSNFETKGDETTRSIQSFFSSTSPSCISTGSSTQGIIASKVCGDDSCPANSQISINKRRSLAMTSLTPSSSTTTALPRIRNHSISTLEDNDLDIAKKLQASFDREDYALSTATRRHKSGSKIKIRRIDSFFVKRG